jgi:molybdate transport system substrate-binding protein
MFNAMMSVLAAAASLLWIASARADEVDVVATGVYEHVVKDLIGPFKNETGHAVRMSVTNAGGVIRKIEASEPADVVMTSAAGIEALAAGGRVDKASKVEVGRMRLGLAVKAGAAEPKIDTFDALRAALIAAPKVAYIDPKGGGTSGPLFEKLFERLGVADQMKAKGVLCATGSDVVRALVADQAVLGLTQASELIGPGGIRFVGYLPADPQLVSVYVAGLSTGARSPDAAKAFLRFVTGPTGRERFRAAGWDVP